MPLSTLDRPRPRAAANQSEAPAPDLRPRLGNPSVFLFVILTAQLMVVLDTTIVNVALPSMQRALDFSASSLSWVLNGYILTFGGLLLLGARAGDLLGRRRVFLTGIALFSLSSLAGGLALAGWMLLAARALQGVGAALAAPSALSLLTTVFPEGPARVRAIALYTTVSAGGGAIGLVAGGLLTDLVSWRWVMFVNVPIGVAVWLVGRVVLVETQRRQGRFDLAGALTSTLGMSGIVLGLVEAGSDGWTRPLTVGPLVAGAALLGFFVHNEARAEEPILPLRLLAHITRSTANVSRGLVYAGMYGLFFFMSQFLQDVQHFSPLAAGVAFLPMPASVFLASQLTSRVLVRRFPLRLVTMAGVTLSAIGLLLAMQLLQPGVAYPEIMAWFVLVGSGSGISFVTLTTASLHEVEAGDAGAASGLINVSQQLGAALGLAVLVTVFGVVTGHAQLGAPHAAGAALTRFQAVVTGGLHDVFGLGLVFTVSALAMVALGIGRVVAPAPAAVPAASSEDELSWLAQAEMAEVG
jgi:EmrB/QacA subfamily drug resistance transporter